MHLPSTMKSVILIIALATQCVSAKSRNGHGYLDEKFYVLEWITYLRHLSLITLMLCGVVLYYMPKSRLYARKACCVLIDLVANGLKFALNITETEYDCEEIKIRSQNDKNKEPKIEEIYRKVCEEDTRVHGQRDINKINISDSNHKSMRKRNRGRFRTKRSAEEKHERHRQHNHHHRNATVKDISSKFGATITSVVDSPQQMAIIDEKYNQDNAVTLQDISPKTAITIRKTSMDKLENNTNLQQRKLVRNNKNCTTKNAETESFSCTRTNSNTVSKISPDYSRKFQTTAHTISQKQEINEHEKVVDVSQRQLRKDYATRSVNKQIADPRYGEVFIKRGLRDRIRRENCRFLHDVKIIVHNCEDPPFITNRVKPVLLRVVNWFFGGCPEASRRHREQVDEVGKEEIFESTNTWLLQTSELYPLQ